MRAQLSSAAYSTGWTLSQRLPEAWVARAFDYGAERTWRGQGRGVRQLRANLRRVHPELDADALDALTRAGLHSYLRYWREAFRLPRWSPEEIDRRIVSSGEDRLFGPLDQRRGVVAVLGHFGNWDHGGVWVTTRGYGLTTVAERLRPESLYDRFVAYRESLGMEVLPLSGGPEVTPVLQARLRAGGLVALLADRDLSGTGLEVEVLGEPARLPVGPALLAERTESVLLPVISSYEGARTRLDFLPPLTTEAVGLRDRVHDLTRQWGDVIGVAARQHAVDWHMLQPVWAADVPQRERVR